MNGFRLLWRPVLLAFLLWHMAAVAFYALPPGGQALFPQSVRSWLGERVRPYVFTLSQWQQWNIFAPDPLRRVSRYVVETQADAGSPWTRVEDLLPPGRFSPFEHSMRMKFYGELFEQDGREPLVERFLQRYCANLPPGSIVRARTNIIVLPKDGRTHSPAWWRAWRPTPRTFHEESIQCHSAA